MKSKISTDSPRRSRSTSTFTMLLAACTFMLVGAACGEGLGGFLVSDADEVEIGRGVDDSIEQEYQIVDDSDPVAVWARDLVTPLSNASTMVTDRDPQDIGGYKVEVIADDELVNAFAAPGGFTYLSTGLILEAQSCAEIAGVMGHELAHVTERHGVEQLESQYGVAVLSQLVLGEGLAGSVVQGIHSFLLGTTYSQDKETEADEVGARILNNAGYNPYGLVDFFETLLALQGGQSPPSFLSSHPATQDRVAAISNQIQNEFPNVVRGQGQYECVGTSMTLAQVQERVRSGQVMVRTTTGTQTGQLDLP